MTVPNPGARVRLTIEGVVRTSQPGEMELVDGTRVECSTHSASLEVLEPGYEVGDVATDGAAHLFRVQPAGESAHWIRPDGAPVHDDEVDPTALTPLVRISSAPQTDDAHLPLDAG